MVSTVLVPWYGVNSIGAIARCQQYWCHSMVSTVLVQIVWCHSICAMVCVNNGVNSMVSTVLVPWLVSTMVSMVWYNGYQNRA